MNSEIKICQNCKKEFVIEPEDFDFYQKIKVPPPTWCPECRMIRRMTWRNEKALYKRKCDATGKEIISIYSPNKPFKVYNQKYWWSDKWEAMEYGRDYDFNKPFFEQFKELFEFVPRSNLNTCNLINCDYCEVTSDSKNCYLIIGGFQAEDCYYCNTVIFSSNSVDSDFLYKSVQSYATNNCINVYQVFFSQFAENCLNSAFLFDCRGCSDCFGCTNLRNKKYYIFNQPFSREEYKKEIAYWDLGSYKRLQEAKERFQKNYFSTPRPFAFLRNTVDVIGDNIQNSKSCYYCFGTRDGVENCKYLFLGGVGLKDSYDVFASGTSSELIYEINGSLGSQNILFSDRSRHCYNLQYCYINFHSSNLFGCIGLRHKQYCILNKQYTKEEYEKLIPKIIEHMNKMPYIDKKGRIYRYGEFFPPELSPFSYNETIAQEYFPLTKEQTLEKGYSWAEPEKRDIKPDIKTKELPDHIKDVRDDIVDKIIQCAHAKLKEDGILEATCNEQCTTAFKIIPQELQFYQRMNLPLPRYCPNCRHFQRLKQRNPLKLWKRKCQCQGKEGKNPNNSYIYKNTIKHFHGDNPCPNEFETTYSPERPEIVYCEKCYLAEVV